VVAKEDVVRRLGKARAAQILAGIRDAFHSEITRVVDGRDGLDDPSEHRLRSGVQDPGVRLTAPEQVRNHQGKAPVPAPGVAHRTGRVPGGLLGVVDVEERRTLVAATRAPDA